MLLWQTPACVDCPRRSLDGASSRPKESDPDFNRSAINFSAIVAVDVGVGQDVCSKTAARRLSLSHVAWANVPTSTASTAAARVKGCSTSDGLASSYTSRWDVFGRRRAAPRRSSSKAVLPKQSQRSVTYSDCTRVWDPDVLDSALIGASVRRGGHRSPTVRLGRGVSLGAVQRRAIRR